MSSRRTLILVGAIAVGAIAALLIIKYVNGIEERAKGDTAMVQVVVVAADVSAGEAADGLIAEGRLALGERRKMDLPANAVTRLDDVKGQTAAIDLAAGEIVTTSKFAGATGNASSKSNVLEPGMVAVTISVDQTRSVAGLIEPGDFVNLLTGKEATATVSADPADPAAPPASDAMGASVLYQKVKVLAIGKNLGAPQPANADGTPAPAPEASDLITLSVPPAAATVIGAAQFSGNLFLTLVRPDYQPQPLPAFIPSAAPLPGEAGRTPYDGAPAGSVSAEAVQR